MEKLNELVMSFFKRMNANILQKSEFFIMDNVDPSFEKVYGKKSPYTISFLEKDRNNSEVDCVLPGTKLFKTIINSLNTNTSTTILKINLAVNPLDEIKKRISLKNCRLKDLKEDYENNFFSRFTFKTNLRYLNKNEELIREIFVHEGKIVRGNLEDYNISEGELKEIDAKYMEKDYALAKNNLREVIQPEIQELTKEISENLDKEINRINSHYDNFKREFQESLERNEKRLKELESEPESPERQEKIQRLQKSNQDSLKQEIKKLEQEQQFTIQDTKQKHALAMDTKLINTTVLYYPQYKLNLILEDGPTKKNFQIIYDPLTNQMGNIECSNCKKEMTELALCKSSHVCCPSCLFRCVSCGGQFCEKCLNNKCNSCGGPICDACTIICKGCKQTYCKQHIREDSFSGEGYCIDCLGFCSECKKSALKKNLIEVSPGKNICFKCQAREKKEKVLKEIFK